MSDTPAEAKAQAKPKPKAKPPKPEDKPFEVFMREEFLPAVNSQLKDHAIAPDRLDLVTGERPVVGGTCPMVVGELPGDRRFWLCFNSEDIASGKQPIAVLECAMLPLTLLAEADALAQREVVWFVDNNRRA